VVQISGSRELHTVSTPGFIRCTASIEDHLFGFVGIELHHDAFAMRALDERR